MKKIILGFICFFAIAISCNGQSLDKDNGAFYYHRALKISPEITAQDRSELSKIISLKELSSAPEDLLSKIKKGFNKEFISTLVTARKCKDCNFRPEGAPSVKQKWVSPKAFRKLAFFINALGWHAISKNKHKLGVNLFITNMIFAQELERREEMLKTIVFGAGIRKLTLKSITGYVKDSPDPEAKKLLLKLLKKFPSPIFNIKAAIDREITFFKRNLKIFESEPKYMASFFYSPDPEEEILKKCKANRRVLLGAIEMAQMDEYITGKESSFEEIHKTLVEKNYVKNPVSCPRGGKYEVIFEKSLVVSKVICSCEENKSKKDLPPHENPGRVALAKKYRESPQFEHDKKIILEYFDAVQKINPSNEEEHKKLIKFDVNSTEHINNVFLINGRLNLRGLVKLEKELQALLEEALDQS